MTDPDGGVPETDGRGMFAIPSRWLWAALVALVVTFTVTSTDDLKEGIRAERVAREKADERYEVLLTKVVETQADVVSTQADIKRWLAGIDVRVQEQTEALRYLDRAFNDHRASVDDESER